MATSHHLCFFLLSFFLLPLASSANLDYQDALHKSLLFFDAQRSGTLSPSHRVSWRGDSGLHDGQAQGVDLVGGYYDAGDHVKFGFPMAFSVTLLCWGVVEYGDQMAASGQLQSALDAIRWGTDYFIKAHPEPNVLWGEVGDGTTDHACWQRAEDMTTSRQAYKIDARNPGSDLAGETAAAMAAASIVFKQTDAEYSQTLLRHATELFTFADTFRGNYDDSITVAREFYQSVSGYKDELLWAAMWLYEATGEASYLQYVVNNAVSFGGTGWAMKEFSWDVKYVGVQVLAAKVLLQGRGGEYTTILQQYQSQAEYFLCSQLQKNTQGNNAMRTPGGLLFTRPWNNMQYVASSAFILAVYSDHLSAAGQQLHCPVDSSVTPSELLSLAQFQVNYILGENPRGMSYLVGFGNSFPQHVHHRGASIVSYENNPTFVSCSEGYADWYNRAGSNPNVIVGALVGGPDENDNYADQRSRYEQSEPTISGTAPLVGILARLNGGQRVQFGSSNSLHNISVLLGDNDPSVVPASLPDHAKRGNAIPHLQSPITIQQIPTATWTHDGSVFTRYEVRVRNIGTGRIAQLKLAIKGLTGSIWGVSNVGLKCSEIYTFPPWLRILAPGNIMKFVYIQTGPPATIEVSSFTATSK